MAVHETSHSGYQFLKYLQGNRQFGMNNTAISNITHITFLPDTDAQFDL